MFTETVPVLGFDWKPFIGSLVYVQHKPGGYGDYGVLEAVDADGAPLVRINPSFALVSPADDEIEVVDQ